MQQYDVTITGLNPLLMHKDNIAAAEQLAAWRKDPANRELSEKGDDRSPAWTWLSYCYHDRKVLGVPSDNLMTMLREGGAKVPNKGKETFKKQTQAGVLIDEQQFELRVGGESVAYPPLAELEGNTDFLEHIRAAEARGFELLIKRAKVGQAKHVRVRPMFRNWSLVGSITVIDEEMSGLTEAVLERIFSVAGALVGLGDWRPASPKASGSFGTFTASLKAV